MIFFLLISKTGKKSIKVLMKCVDGTELEVLSKPT